MAIRIEHAYKKLIKVSNGAKIRNRYNQVPHLTQDKPIFDSKTYAVDGFAPSLPVHYSPCSIEYSAAA